MATDGLIEMNSNEQGGVIYRERLSNDPPTMLEQLGPPGAMRGEFTVSRRAALISSTSGGDHTSQRVDTSGAIGRKPLVDSLTGVSGGLQADADPAALTRPPDRPGLSTRGGAPGTRNAGIRRMRRFESPGHAQRVLSAYGPIVSHFRPRRHRLSAPAYRQEMGQRFQVWREVTGLAPVASVSSRVQ
jgi:hypothetical protein